MMSTVSFVGDSSDPGCYGTVTRTYRITDVCGNHADITQNILINDTISPTFNEALPADATASCLTIPSQATLTASDNCGSATVVTTVDSYSVDNCNGYDIVYRWVATDNCSNTTTHTQTIHVVDDVAPTINCPTDVTIECSENIPSAYATLTDFVNAGGSFSDDCGIDNTSFAYIGESINSSTCPKIITRTYQIADDCGNTSTCDHIITVTDTEAPVIHDVPGNVDFPCSDCIQSFLNADFEQNPSVNCWAYLNENVVPGWETTSGNNNIELQESGCVDGVTSHSGNYHAELNADLTGDFYQEFCTVPTTWVQISFWHHKRMAGINTTDDIMGVYAGP